MKIAAVFLAAGSSTRMGKSNKLLLNYNNTTLVEHTFKKLKNSIIDEIIIVTGFEASEIQSSLNKEKAIFTHNSNHLKGMTSSIQTGVKVVGANFCAYMITLSDMPYLSTADYNVILNYFKENYKEKPLIVMPKVNQRSGNPVIFSKEWTPEILKCQNTEGCKDIILKNDKFVKKVSLNNLDAFKDIDQPEDYQKLTDVRAKPDN